MDTRDYATPADFTGILPKTLMETLQINVLEATPERVTATMPVGPRVHQPFGVLHGGASVALAESVASIGASVNLDLNKQMAVGLEINANHLRTVREGLLTAVATPLHLGRSTQVWHIEICDEDEKLVCVSRCTLAVLTRRAV